MPRSPPTTRVERRPAIDHAQERNPVLSSRRQRVFGKVRRRKYDPRIRLGFRQARLQRLDDLAFDRTRLAAANDQRLATRGGVRPPPAAQRDQQLEYKAALGIRYLCESVDANHADFNAR